MSVVQLYRLQLLDLERDELLERLAEIGAGLTESVELNRAREAVVETEAELDRMRKRLRVLEREITDLTVKWKANQERTYGGRIRDPKAATALRQEAAYLRQEVGEREDEQLELMVGLDDGEAELAERQARLRQIEAQWQADQSTLREEQTQLSSRLADREEEIEDQRARTVPAELEEYDHLRDRLGGAAVAQLKHGICQTCGVDVPTGMASAVERGEGLHHCPVCSRLLFGG